MRVLKILLLFMTVFLITGSSFAAVLTFDDIGTTGGNIPYGYGGFNWVQGSSWVDYLNGNTNPWSGPGPYPGNGYHNGVVSGDYVAYSVSGTISAADGYPALFDFNGAWLTSGWRDYMDITVYGYLNGDLVYSPTVTLRTSSATWFDFNFLGIDRLSFGPVYHTGTLIDSAPADDGLYLYAMDNFTFNEDSAPVPEPTTIILFGLGLLGLAGVSRRKK